MVDFVERNPKNPGQGSGPKPPPPASGRPKPRKTHEQDIQVNCPECGREFSVLTALAGSEAACPGCAKPVQVPQAKGKVQPSAGLKKPDSGPPAARSKPKPVADPGAKKAQAAAEDGPSEKKPSIRKVRQKVDLKTQPKCPECEAVLEADAVLCVQCGYDLRKKEQTVISRKKKLNPVIPVVILLALLGGSYAVYELVLKPNDEAATPTSLSTTPVAQEPESDAATEPAIEVESDTAVEMATEPASIPEPELEPEVVVETEPEPVVEDPVAVVTPVDPREEVRSLMAGKLDAQYPVAAVGDTVSLTTLDGTEYTGALTAIERDTLRLKQDGVDVDLPLENLERRSRARLDTTYRDAMIDQLTDRYMARKAAAN